MQPHAVRFAGVGVGELAVTVVRQREVPRAAVVELLDPGDRGGLVAERVAVLDPDQRDLPARGGDPADVAEVSASWILSGAISLVRRWMASNFSLACW